MLETELENGAYHVKDVHVFRNSVSTDSITNNNAPQLLQNFTPYPNRQPSSYNYQSSTLTGYIGRVNFKENRYEDTVDMADRLRALSVSTAPKFLRDRKGNLWRIETGAAVAFQTGDNQVPQPYFGTFPWVEVGSVQGASIVSGPGDWGEVDSGSSSLAPAGSAIVVTAETGAEVTILRDGALVLKQVYSGPVTYRNPTAGTYTISAVKDDRNAQAIITITEPVTYYVGLALGGPIIIEAVAPSGSTVTVSGNGFSETKEVP